MPILIHWKKTICETNVFRKQKAITFKPILAQQKQKSIIIIKQLQPCQRGRKGQREESMFPTLENVLFQRVYSYAEHSILQSNLK